MDILSSDPMDPKMYPSGITSPLEVVTETDRGAIIAVTTTVSLTIVLLVALPTGVYIRLRTSAYRADYYIFLAAVLVFLSQTVAVYFELSGGLGKTMDMVSMDDWNRIYRAGYAADILYLLTMYLSKCAIALIFLRLSPGRGHAIAVKSILAGLTAWILMAVFVIFLRCHPAEPWFDTTNAKCPNLFGRWAIIGALDIVSEFALFGMSIYLVWNVRMAMKSKATVIGAFGSRLPIVVLAAFRLHFLQIQLNSDDPSFDAANTVALTQFEIGFGLFACILPVMKPFLASHEGPLLNGGYTGDNYKLTPQSGGSSNLKRSQANNSLSGTVIDRDYATHGGPRLLSIPKISLQLRPDNTSYMVGAVRHDRQQNPGSMDSEDSHSMFIKKDVDFSVRYGKMLGKNHRMAEV